MCLETNQFVYTKWHIFYSGAQHYDYVGKEFPHESVNLWSQRMKFKQSNENWSNVNKQVHIASSLILRTSILCALSHNASKFCTCTEVRRKHCNSVRMKCSSSRACIPHNQSWAVIFSVSIHCRSCLSSIIGAANVQ